MHGGVSAVWGRTVATNGFSKNLRLIRTEDFGVVLKTRNDRSFFARSRYFSLQALRTEAPECLRIGITVGKKNAHRSVDRALVKRLLREAARHQAPSLLALLRESGSGLDVSLRLKEPLYRIAGTEVGVTALKRNLHEDLRHLMEELSRRAVAKLGSSRQ